MTMSATLLTFSFLTLTLAALPATTALRAQSVAPPALAGQVASVEEGAMEGVLVTARKTGASIATTVVSDASGHYAFPRARLEPGSYAITMRAASMRDGGTATYNPAAHVEVTVRPRPENGQGVHRASGPGLSASGFGEVVPPGVCEFRELS